MNFKTSKITPAQKTALLSVLQTYFIVLDTANIELTASGSVIIMTPKGRVEISNLGKSTIISI